MSEYFCSAEELLPERTFTCPAKTIEDRAVIKMALDALQDLMKTPEYGVLDAYPAIIYRHEEGRCHRFVINNSMRLRMQDELTLVGFFGRRHSKIDSQVLNEADALLLSEFREHPEMLVYCSYQRDLAQYGNVVIFASPDAQLHWSTSRHHAHAARVIAPQYYSHIRLHTGRVTGGLLSLANIIIAQTKYFDYAVTQPTGEPWRGVRIYPATAS